MEIQSKHLPKAPQVLRIYWIPFATSLMWWKHCTEVLTMPVLNWVLEKGRCRTAWNCWVAVQHTDLKCNLSCGFVGAANRSHHSFCWESSQWNMAGKVSVLDSGGYQGWWSRLLKAQELSQDQHLGLLGRNHIWRICCLETSACS